MNGTDGKDERDGSPVKRKTMTKVEVAILHQERPKRKDYWFKFRTDGED